MPPTSPNSPMDKSGPAVTLTKIPFAPRMFVSSSSGLLNALRAASAARVAPVAEAAPIMACPISDITVFTSAKSTLIRPGLVINSEIP